jgi:hypothetical protein
VGSGKAVQPARAVKSASGRVFHTAFALLNLPDPATDHIVHLYDPANVSSYQGHLTAPVYAAAQWSSKVKSGARGSRGSTYIHSTRGGS